MCCPSSSQKHLSPLKCAGLLILNPYLTCSIKGKIISITQPNQVKYLLLLLMNEKHVQVIWDETMWLYAFPIPIEHETKKTCLRFELLNKIPVLCNIKAVSQFSYCQNTKKHKEKMPTNVSMKWHVLFTFI